MKGNKMSVMTAEEALDLVENTMANLAISLNAHIQVKQLLAQIRQQEKQSREPEPEPAIKFGKKRETK